MTVTTQDSFGREFDERPRQRLFTALVALAIFLAELARSDERDSLWVPLTGWAVAIAIACILRIGLRRRWSKHHEVGLAILTTLGALLPLVCESIFWAIGWPRLPLELVALGSLRNILVALGIIAGGAHPSLAVFVSLFIAIFALTQVAHPLVLPLVGVLGLLIVTWFSLYIRGRSHRPALPLGPIVVVAIGYMLITWAHTSLPPLSGLALAELLASSGGTGQQDDQARAGVGDGDAIVEESERPESDGGDGSKILESDQPSFYDAFTEAYGEPLKPKGQQRAVPLPMELVTGHQKARHHQASREFSLQRQPRRRSGTPGNREATVLAYVAGVTPLHLRLEAYTEFDGTAWQAREPADPVPALVIEEEHRFQCRRPPEALRADMVVHAIKIGSYNDRVLPIPALAAEFRVGVVNRVDLFHQPASGVIQIADPAGRISGGEIIETNSDTVDYSSVPAYLEQYPQQPSASHSRPVGEGLRATLRSLAHEWCGHLNSDWDKILAVTQHLRNGYVHEHAAAASGGDIVQFLRGTRSGPDYMFATTAALLYRELGFASRLAMGYYAAPDNYDPWSRTTPITTGDVHTWPEILIGGVWIPMEPTPGYELLPPHRSWATRFKSLLTAFFATCADRWSSLAPLTLFACFVWASRAWLLDQLVTTIWRIEGRIRPDRVMGRTLWLIDWRLRLAGAERPRQLSLRRWLRHCASSPHGGEEAIERFLELLDIHCYGLRRTLHPQIVVPVCHGIIETLTTSRLRYRPHASLTRQQDWRDLFERITKLRRKPLTA